MEEYRPKHVLIKVQTLLFYFKAEGTQFRQKRACAKIKKRNTTFCIRCVMLHITNTAAKRRAAYTMCVEILLAVEIMCKQPPLLIKCF